MGPDPRGAPPALTAARAASRAGRAGVRCGRCARPLDGRTAFELQTAAGPGRCCLACALRHRPLLARSGRIALIVGTALTAINHGDLIVAGHWVAAMLWKIPLTYAMPFAVATWGALSNSRRC